MMLLHFESLCILLLVFKICFLKAHLIGDGCKYDDECFVNNSYCKMQEKCECREHFLPSIDRETCIAMIGAHCHSKLDCSTFPNSFCIEDRCECDHGYVPNSEKTKCLPIAHKIRDGCEQDCQCTERLGGQSHCSNKQCVCYPGCHFVNRCISSKRLNEECRNSYECFIGENYQNTVHCLNGYCKCAPGYHEDRNVCVVSVTAGSSHLLSGVGLLIVFTILVNFSL